MRVYQAIRRAARAFSATGSGVLAQAIAYNALFAIFPLALLLAAILGFLSGTEDGARQTLALLEPVTPVGAKVLQRELHHVVQYRGISGVLGLLILIWSAKNVFLTVTYALDRALGTPREGPIVRNALVATLMIPLLGALLLASAVFPLALDWAARLGGLTNTAWVAQAAAYVTSVLLFFGMSAALYRWLPNASLSFRLVIPGALFCAVAWTVLQLGFGVYSAHADFSRVYGAIAGIMVLLLWFYCMAAILLFGAHFFIAWSGLPHRQQTIDGATAPLTPTDERTA